MTTKELLYLEESLGMEQQLETKCNDYAGRMQDPHLKELLQQLAQKHQMHYMNLMNQLH